MALSLPKYQNYIKTLINITGNEEFFHPFQSKTLTTKEATELIN